MRGITSQSVASYLIRACLASVLVIQTVGCSEGEFFDLLSTDSVGSLSGYIVLASSNAVGGAAGSSGAVALYNPAGEFVRAIRDYYASAEVPEGLAIIGRNTLLVNVDGSDRLELVNAQTAEYSIYPVSGVSGSPGRSMTVDADNNVFVAEYSVNTIEKIDSTGTRVGTPFISSGGGCTMSNVWGLTYIPTTNRLVASNYSNSNLLFYNVSTGGCVSSVTNAAYGTNTTSIAYHAQTDKILTARIGDERIYAANSDGSSPVIVYYNTSRVNNPYAITVDSDGYVYVAASVQHTVEKFSFSGTTLTTVQSGPLIGPSAFTQNITQIVVFP